METISKQRSNMRPIHTARKVAFPDASIKEVETVALSEFVQIDEQVSLIESFTQPFPLRERGSPVMDGEMDSYG
jgi:hypothetical protein